MPLQSWLPWGFFMNFRNPICYVSAYHNLCNFQKPNISTFPITNGQITHTHAHTLACARKCTLLVRFRVNHRKFDIYKSSFEKRSEIRSMKLKTQRIFCGKQNPAKHDTLFQQPTNLPRIVPFRICWRRFLPVGVLPFQLAIGIISGLRRSPGQRSREMFHNCDWNISDTISMFFLFSFVHVSIYCLISALYFSFDFISATVYRRSEMRMERKLNVWEAKHVKEKEIRSTCDNGRNVTRYFR